MAGGAMAMGGGAPGAGGGPSFSTNVGGVRSFSPDGYAATVGSGGTRGTVTSPTQKGPATPPAGVKPNGYVPTYARYGALVPTTPAAVPKVEASAAPVASSYLTGAPSTGVTALATPSAPHLTTPANTGGVSMAGPGTSYTAGPGSYFTAATGLGPSSSASQFRNAGVHVFQLPQQGPLEGGYFDAFNNAMQQAAQGYANIEGQQFQQSVGKMLGGLNSIGGLRSGAVIADTNNLMNTYAGDVSNYNAELATKAAELGEEANMANQGIQQSQQQFDLKRKDASKAALASAIGSIIGDVPKIMAGFGGVGGAAKGVSYANAGSNG